LSLSRHTGANFVNAAEQALIISWRRINLSHALLGRFLPDSNRRHRPRFFF